MIISVVKHINVVPAHPKGEVSGLEEIRGRGEEKTRLPGLFPLAPPEGELAAQRPD